MKMNNRKILSTGLITFGIFLLILGSTVTSIAPVSGATGTAPQGPENSLPATSTLSANLNYSPVFLAPPQNDRYAVRGTSTSAGRLDVTTAYGTGVGNGPNVNVQDEDASEYWPRYWDTFEGQMDDDGLDYNDMHWAFWSNTTDDLNGTFSLDYQRNSYSMSVGETLEIPPDAQVPTEVNLYAFRPGVVMIYVDQSFTATGWNINIIDSAGKQIGGILDTILQNSLDRQYVLFVAETAGWYQLLVTFNNPTSLGHLRFESKYLTGITDMALGSSMCVNEAQDEWPDSQTNQETNWTAQIFRFSATAFGLYRFMWDKIRGTYGSVNAKIFYPTVNGYAADQVATGGASPGVAQDVFYFCPDIAVGNEYPVTKNGWVYVVISNDNPDYNPLHYCVTVQQDTATPYTLGTSANFDVAPWDRTYVSVTTAAESFYMLEEEELLPGTTTLYGPGATQSIQGNPRYKNGFNIANGGLTGGWTAHILAAGTSIWTIRSTANTAGRLRVNTTVIPSGIAPEISLTNKSQFFTQANLTALNFAAHNETGVPVPAHLTAALTNPTRARLNLTMVPTTWSQGTGNTTAPITKAFVVNSSDGTHNAVTDVTAAITSPTGASVFPSSGFTGGDYLVVGMETLYKGVGFVVLNNGTNITLGSGQYWDGQSDTWRNLANLNPTYLRDIYGTEWGPSGPASSSAVFFDPQNGAFDWDEETTALTINTQPLINHTDAQGGIIPMYWMRIRLQSVDDPISSVPVWGSFGVYNYYEYRVKPRSETWVTSKNVGSTYSNSNNNFYTGQPTAMINNWDHYGSTTPITIENSWLYTVAPNMLTSDYTAHWYIEPDFEVNRENTQQAEWNDISEFIPLYAGIVDYAGLLAQLSKAVEPTDLPMYNTESETKINWGLNSYEYTQPYNYLETVWDLDPGTTGGAIVTVTGDQYDWTQLAHNLVNGTNGNIYLFQEVPWDANRIPAVQQNALNPNLQDLAEWGALSSTMYLYVQAPNSQPDGIVHLYWNLTQYATPQLTWQRTSLNVPVPARPVISPITPAVSNNGSSNVTWTSVPGAWNYKFYRSDYPYWDLDRWNMTLYDNTTTSVLDQIWENGTYYYTVQAIDQNGVHSQEAVPVTVTVALTVEPPSGGGIDPTTVWIIVAVVGAVAAVAVVGLLIRRKRKIF